MAVSSVAAYLLAIPQVPHVDDLCGVETPGGMPSARASLVELFDVLQFRLKESKASPPRSISTGASSLVALGALFCFSISDEDRKEGIILHIDLPAEEAARYSLQISSIL